jgi:heme exporter protein A
VHEVQLKGIVKDYGRQRALHAVSLRLQAGEATALLGENGAGKSTLMNILATLLRPTRGQVLYDGHPREALDPEGLRAALAVLSHEPRLYGDLSGRENLRFFARLYDLPGLPEIEEHIERLLERVGLAHAADRPVRTYSRGMTQRLAVARTLLHRPALLLLDEPTTGLDQAGVQLLLSLLREERDRGAILLLTSHDLSAVAPLCDRAVLLRRGRVAGEARYPRGTCTGAALLALYEGGA